METPLMEKPVNEISAEQQQQLTATVALEPLIRHVLAMYQCDPSAEHFVYYDEKAVFEDPLSICEGRDEVHSVFCSLPKLFNKSETLNYSVKMESSDLLILNLKQKWTPKLLHKDIVIDHIIRLQLNNQGRIVRHEDTWNGKPLPTGPKLPGIGSVSARLRRFMGYVTGIMF
eukprot:GILK01013448.1.p1 GENE.GILK01013448.1~~GILK01013448.1.p1  ORF type:complete len:172 (-),score=16.55 GILK01013448.1:44-559(-)